MTGMQRRSLCREIHARPGTGHVRDGCSRRSFNLESRFVIPKITDMDSGELDAHVMAMRPTHIVIATPTRKLRGANDEMVEWLFQVNQAHEVGAAANFSPIYKMVFQAPHCQSSIWGETRQKACYSAWARPMLESLRGKGFLVQRDAQAVSDSKPS